MDKIGKQIDNINKLFNIINQNWIIFFCKRNMLINKFKVFDFKNIILIPIVSKKTIIMLLLCKKLWY